MFLSQAIYEYDIKQLESNILKNTNAYLRLKKQVQETFDFAVVVCHSIPALKRQIALLNDGTISSLPKPDYFPEGVTPPSQLKQQAIDYKRQLSSYLLLSCFSFFEAFVIDAVNEMIEFHGGIEKFIRRAEKRERDNINETLSSNLEKAKRILSKPDKAAHILRYQKYSKTLVDNGYRFPTERFSAYGARMLVQRIGNLRANDIPDLLKNGLYMDISEREIQKFHEIRDIRNKIAHGEKVNLYLRNISEKNNFLRNMAKLTDQHLVKNFFISEEFI